MKLGLLFIFLFLVSSVSLADNSSDSQNQFSNQVGDFSIKDNYALIKDDIVYNEFYVSTNGSNWTARNLTGDFYPTSNKWIRLSAIGEIPIFDNNEHYIIYFSCSNNVTNWNCHNNKWQLKVIDAKDSSAGNTSSGGSGGSSINTSTNTSANTSTNNSVTHECSSDSDCDDNNFQTKNICAGSPRVCSNPIYAVNLNGDNYISTLGVVFEKDNPDYFVSGILSDFTDQAIQNTDDDVLFQSQRLARVYFNSPLEPGLPLEYKFPVAIGSYDVELFFSEIWCGSRDPDCQRPTNIFIEDKKVEHDFAIGPLVLKGEIKDYKNNLVTDGFLNIKLNYTSKSDPGLAAIKISQGEKVFQTSMFNFDLGFGQTVINSFGYYLGTLKNATSWTVGVNGSAINFSGGFIDLGIDTGLDDELSELTISAWINPSISDAGYQGLVMHGAAGDLVDSFALYIYPKNKGFGFKTTGTTGDFMTVDNIDIFDCNWHHVVATYDGAKKSIYVDGILIDSIDSVGAITSGEGYRLLLGAGRDSVNPTLLYDGLMDSVIISNESISSSQVSTLYNDANYQTLSCLIDQCNSGSDCIDNDPNTLDVCSGSPKVCSNTIINTGVHTEADYYLAPYGSDSNDGSFDSPFYSLNKVWPLLQAGDLIYMRGGVYEYNDYQNLNGKSGTVGNMIKLFAYPGETPIINPAPGYTSVMGVYVRGAYLHIKGLDVSNFVQRTSDKFYLGLQAYDVDNSIFEQLNVHHNGFGFSISGPSSDNLVLNSDFHDNADPITDITTNTPFGGSDGLTIRSSDPDTTNTIKGCRMWRNSDDGVDLWTSDGMIVIEDSWAFWNGLQPDSTLKAGDGNGFKLGKSLNNQGELKRRLVNNIAFQNTMWGYNSNNCYSDMELYNNIAYANCYLDYNLDWCGGFTLFRPSEMTGNQIVYYANNNIAYNNVKTEHSFSNYAQVNHNSWDSSVIVTDSDFVSVDPLGVTGPRKADGSLPDIDFLKLSSSSDLIDQGVDVGLDYSGAAPDIGIESEHVLSNSCPDGQVLDENNVCDTPSSNNYAYPSPAFYTNEELAMWRDRSVNGPFKDSGDAYIGSSGEWSRIKAYADSFDRYKNEVVLNGTCVPAAEVAGTTISSSEFGRIGVARDAAFYDLVMGTNTYTADIKELLLEQAQKPCMNFSDRYYYPYHNKDGMWLYGEWLHRVLLTYEYVGRDAFTLDEQKIIDDWFKGGADWLDYVITDRGMDHLYVSRTGLPDSYEINWDYWGNTGVGKEVYKDSTIFHPPGSWINNRQFGIANFITHAGVMYDNSTWKEIGAQLVREYVSFHFDDNGYYAELMRSYDAKPGYGLAYGANTLVNAAEIAHILYKDGYTNLFEYKSNITIDPLTGDIMQGDVEKSLDWVLFKFRENFMELDSDIIFPLGDVSGDMSKAIHFCLSEDPVVPTYVIRMYSSAAILNNYYQNSTLKEIYASPIGNLCGVNDNSQLRQGPHSIAPGFLFQYADVNTWG